MTEIRTKSPNRNLFCTVFAHDWTYAIKTVIKHLRDRNYVAWGAQLHWMISCKQLYFMIQTYVQESWSNTPIFLLSEIFDRLIDKLKPKPITPLLSPVAHKNIEQKKVWIRRLSFSAAEILMRVLVDVKVGASIHGYEFGRTRDRGHFLNSNAQSEGVDIWPWGRSWRWGN